MDMALDTVVPESLPWEHVDEGTISLFSFSNPSLSPHFSIYASLGVSILYLLYLSTDVTLSRLPPCE